MDNLEILVTLLQQRLGEEFPKVNFFEVRCVIRNGVLMTLVEHPNDLLPDPEQTYKIIEQAINDSYQGSTVPVNLFLRIEGTDRPYSSYKFTGGSSPEPSVRFIPDSQTIDISVANDSPLISDTNLERTEPETESDRTEPEIVETTNLDREEEYSPLIFVAEDLEYEPVEQVELEPEVVPAAPGGRFYPLLPTVALGTGISLLFFFSSFYALTRPCVIDSCQAMASAEALSDRSTKIVEQPQSGQELLQAQQELDAAIDMLKTIPFWSSQHRQAQELLGTYQLEAQRLNQVLQGLSKGNLASQKSQKPPYSVSEWLEMHQLWSAAIADLESIPDDTNLYPFAQEKVQEYQQNLATVKRRLNEEQQAQRNLDLGKINARMAKARQGIAQNLESWERVEAIWEDAIAKLDLIPEGTTAYAEAQDLVKKYQSDVLIARDRKTQEQVARNAYNESLSFAQEANNFQASDQLSSAIANWRNALTYLKQVPKETFYYIKAQQLTQSYTKEMKETQANLQFAMNREKADEDLSNTCSGTPQVCNYTITNSKIEVRLTPPYAEKVRQTSQTAKARRDDVAQIGVINQVLILGDSLETISKNASLPLEVYGPDGALIQKHTP